MPGMSEPREITIQHVLVSFEGTPTEAERPREEAEQLATSVLEEAQAGADFTELVRKHSDDVVREGDESPGVYKLLNHDVEGRTFAEFVAELNERAHAKEQELVAKIQAGELPQEQAEQEMRSFVESLQAEGDQEAGNLPHPRAAMVPAFGDVGFGLEVGEVGVATFDEKSSPFGWHVIKRLA